MSYANYSNWKINEIRDLDIKDRKKLFSLLKSSDYKEEEKAYWKDIFKATALYMSGKDISTGIKQYPSEEQLIALIKEFSFDINYVDRGGQNLLMYTMSVENSFKSNDVPNYKAWLNYLENNTEDIFLLNRSEENILFNFTSFHSCGVRGKDFFKFIERVYQTKLNLNEDTVDQSKGFNLHQVNTLGRNVMFDCLSNTAPQEVVEFYLANNVATNLTDKDGYNLLYFITRFAVNGYDGRLAQRIFDKVFEELENPFAKNKYKNSFLEDIVSFAVGESVHPENKKKYTDWIKLSFKKIRDGEYQFNQESKNSLEVFFSEIKKNKNQEFNYNLGKELREAEVSFNARVLRNELSEDLPNIQKNSMNKKSKI